jgi:hypothetical protein
MAHEYPLTKSPSLRRRTLLALLGGLAIGIVVGLTAAFVASFALGHPTAKADAPRTGNFTISMQDNLLTEGMRLALQRVQGQLPFTIASVQAVTRQGDDIELTASGQQILGIVTPSLTIALAPTVTNGQIDFRVLNINGVSFNPLNSVIESTLNDQFADLAHGSLVKGLDYQLEDVHTIAGALVVTASLYQPS